ncbi:MAG: hypothetical protein LBG88_01295 [Christensenellaceae bacterium]|jgi:hypothetical protein|nr:hypothetical protein [Christensenellaceae bacterium]
MYKTQKSDEHKRDAHGNVYVPVKYKREKSTASSFISVAVTTLALGLVITGLLLHASVQNNQANLAKIEHLERAAMTRNIEPTPNVTKTEEPKTVLPEPIEIDGEDDVTR